MQSPSARMAGSTVRQDVPVANQSRPVRNVISYLQTLDGSTHPALDSINTGVVYDNEKAIYVLEESVESLDDEMEREAKLFAEALKSYEMEVPEKYKTGFDLDRPCSIREVVNEIDSSLKAYKQDGQKTVWEAIRKGFWSLSESSDGLQTWLELLPSSNDYCSLIYGGMNLILKAAGRIGDVRNEAFRAMTEIPIHLENTKEAVGIFSKSEPLRKCGVKLYTATLEALGHILKWFKRRAVGKAFGALLKQGSYERELIEKIKRIERVSIRFKDISLSCLQREVVTTSRTVNSLAVASTNNHVIIQEAIVQSKTLLSLKLEKTNEALEDLILKDTRQHETTQQVLGEELKALKRQYTNQVVLNEKTAETLNHLQTLLESIFAALPLYQIPKDSHGCEGSSPPPYTDYVKSSTILEVLGYEKDISEKDLVHCLRGVSMMSRREQDRAVWPMKSQKLRQWMLSSSSSAIIINGNCSSTSVRSPITFVCARLIDSLKANKPFMVIHFFCSQHIASVTDTNASPLGMMNSLLAQLLVQYPDFEISSHDLADVSHNTLDSVARLFVKLVAQLPSTVILFCVIDGISLYEDQVRLAETRKVMHQLTGLLEERGGPIFKLMLTSATRIKNPPERLDMDDILVVPKNVPPETHFSSPKWVNLVGSNLIDPEVGEV